MNAEFQKAVELAIDRYVSGQQTVKPQRDKELRAYGQGCQIGSEDAVRIFKEGVRPGSNWQGAVLQQIPDADNELRGWIVGYLYTLQCLSLAGGHRI